MDQPLNQRYYIHDNNYTRLNPQSEVAPSGQIIRLKPYKNSWWRYLRFEKVITSDRIMSMISKSRSDRIESVTKVTQTEDTEKTQERTHIDL